MTIIHTIQTWRERRAAINQKCCDIDATMPSQLDRLEAIAAIDYSDEAIAERLVALIREDTAAHARREELMRRVEEDLWMY